MFLPTDEPASLLVSPFISSSSSIRPLFPSKTPWISDIVLSRLLLLVLGLVIVVPKLACLECPCPLLPPGEIGEIGLPGGGCEIEDKEVLIRDKGGSLPPSSEPSTAPFGNTSTSVGELDCIEDPKIALPSSESASKRSGGRRSFSISDLRLRGKFW